jgi:D-alanyl-lipoteichoic acid acyltransferase DltB (MBOAT superfamily)
LYGLLSRSYLLIVILIILKCGSRANQRPDPHAHKRSISILHRFALAWYFLHSVSPHHVLPDKSRSLIFPFGSERDKQTGRLPELSLSEFATYVVFYPSLVAGPIDRAERFAQDLRQESFLTQGETFIGGQRILLGLFKKFVIADALALIALNDALATQVHTTGWMWIILYAYTFQIYFDFSGYTDIAIGIARLVGIKLPENFAAPYLKPNLTQFWNSWHMTLTQWVRSYFFNPFNRWIRSFQNLSAWQMILMGQVATMLLIGLWHGITLNFIFWGLWHGLGLFVHNRWSDFIRTRYPNMQQDRLLRSVLQIGGIVLTFHFVALGWVFFALTEPALSWQVFLTLLY